MEKVLVVGLGEVGMALYEIIKESGKYEVYGVDPLIHIDQELPNAVDIMHVCFPYKESFIDSILNYVNLYNPKLLIINSTVVPMTTFKVSSKLNMSKIVFSPVLGTHRNKEYFKSDMRYFGKFVGGITDEATKLTIEHFDNIGIPTQITKSPLEAEILKIYSTTYYGVLIALSQEFHRLSQSLGADFQDIVKGVCYLQDKSFIKPPSYPAVIGGHCVMPNIEIMLGIYNSGLLNEVKKSNQKRKKEMENEEIFKEVTKIKEMLDIYWREFNDKNRKKL